MIINAFVVINGFDRKEEEEEEREREREREREFIWAPSGF